MKSRLTANRLALVAVDLAGSRASSRARVHLSTAFLEPFVPAGHLLATESVICSGHLQEDEQDEDADAHALP